MRLLYLAQVSSAGEGHIWSSTTWNTTLARSERSSMTKASRIACRLLLSPAGYAVVVGTVVAGLLLSTCEHPELLQATTQ